MKTRIPAPDTLAAYERAAEEIGELRRKGIHCHLEERGDPGGHCIDVVRDDEEAQASVLREERGAPGRDD